MLDRPFVQYIFRIVFGIYAGGTFSRKVTNDDETWRELPHELSQLCCLLLSDCLDKSRTEKKIDDNSLLNLF